MSAPRSEDEHRGLSSVELDTEVDTLFGDHAAWIGRTIDDRYRILDRLGEGGMGTIYIAEHLTLGKRVALKTVHPEFAGDGAVAERFAREATATAKLDHPHVASAIDYGLLPEGGAYLVMQLVLGHSLHEEMDRHGAIAWPRACAIASQIADALAAAHGKGIVHRDLKPENVMLEPRDDGSELVKVLDFGIARVKSSGDGDSIRPPAPTGSRKAAPPRALTQVGMVVGTPGYMAPEQAKGSSKVDHRADLYALGVLIWEMISGLALFDSEDFREILALQLANDVAPLQDTVPPDDVIPPALQELVDSLITVKPDKRPDSASEVRDVLREIGMQAIVEGDNRARAAMRLTPPSGRYSLDPEPTEAPALDKGHFEDKKGGLKIWVISLVAALAIGGIVLGVALLKKPAEPEQNPELIEELFEKAKQVHAAQELERQVGLLFDERDKDIRRQAALWLLDHEPADEVEPYVRSVANLELARGCREIRGELQRLATAGDVRVIPAIQRMSDTPHTCGPRNRGDCYACVRRDIEDALESLHAAEAAAEGEPAEEAEGAEPTEE
ncbi:MAG: serine/threonine protein kinase [Deltaproteobacteria bacterium]|nr:serine/threonine protein kinase [Deltaproteobacteria bacterium]